MPLFFLGGGAREAIQIVCQDDMLQIWWQCIWGRKSGNWGPCDLWVYDLPNSTFGQLLFPFPVPVSSWREKASPTKQVMVLMVTTTLLLGRGGNPNYNIWIHIIFVFLLRVVPVAQWPEKDCMEAWVNFECGKNTGKLILRGVVQNVTLRAVNLHEQKGLQ